MNPHTLVKLARLFGVTPDEISPDLSAELRQAGLLALPNSEMGWAIVANNDQIAPQIGFSASTEKSDTLHSLQRNETANVPIPLQYSVDDRNVRRVFVVNYADTGMPETLWTDGDHPVGVTDHYAELATTDPRAFLSPIVGTLMSPRFNPGEFALVEPGTEPELEDDVLVRMMNGETMLRRLVSRRGGVQLASYGEPGTLLLKESDISWMYYVAHAVPARKIRQRM